MKKYWIKRIIKYGILGLILVWATIFIYDHGRKSYEDYVNRHENDIEWIEENIQFIEDYKIGDNIFVVEMPDTLDISHDEYSYQDYLSVIFYVSFYTGGAHPEHRISSFVYDVSRDKIITIHDLVREKAHLLSILSTESRKILSKNPNIHDQELLFEGTSPEKSNFQTFVFTSRGIMIYFPEYQIAPYSSGAFKIVIPYDQL